jgi:hypothetical protein
MILRPHGECAFLFIEFKDYRMQFLDGDVRLMVDLIVLIQLG